MSDALITLNNISLSHNGKNILDDVSFKLHPGEFITLIGPNGAGKSSLIKILLGVIKQDAGEIIHSGNLKLGYTPQSFTANPYIPISVIDFLTLNQKFDRVFTSQTCELTGIEDLLEMPLKNLSGGELQKVLLTRALLNKPNVLILDEPAQNLDVDGQMQLYKLIQDIHQKQNCAVLMVSRSSQSHEGINSSSMPLSSYLL
jgi:zinc transport system ATP-binding protein